MKKLLVLLVLLVFLCCVSCKREFRTDDIFIIYSKELNSVKYKYKYRYGVAKYSIINNSYEFIDTYIFISNENYELKDTIIFNKLNHEK